MIAYFATFSPTHLGKRTQICSALALITNNPNPAIQMFVFWFLFNIIV